MRRIEKQFTYPIWDEWRTNSFKQGRTGTHTYKGPEFITVEVNKDPNHEEYGKESGWCLTRKEEFERPTAEDPNILLTLICISFAALFVKVTASI